MPTNGTPGSTAIKKSNMVLSYIIALLGALLGLLLTIFVQSEIINRSQKFAAGWSEAFRFYTTKERGAIYIGLLTIAIFLFVMPNLISSEKKYLENFVANLRWWSIAVGIGSQAIGFLLVKKTHQKIDQIDKE